MKNVFISAALAGVAVLFSACASTPMRAPTAAAPLTSVRHARLQLTVDTPPSMNLLRQEDVEDVFAYRVAVALREQGLRGPIAYVSRGDPIDPNVPVLATTLREWRVDALGNVNCIFTANLETPGGNRPLGAFSGTAMMRWSRPSWYDRQQDFEDAAQDALSNLGRRIVQTGLVPDAQMR